MFSEEEIEAAKKTAKDFESGGTLRELIVKTTQQQNPEENTEQE